MNLNPRLRNFLGGAAATLMGVSLVGTAFAITSDTFTYSPGRTGYLPISPLAMIPDGFSATYYTDFTAQKVGTSAVNGQCMNTGIVLPQGATIVALTTWYRNAPTSSSVPTFRLFRQSVSTGTPSIIVSIVGSDTSNTRKLGYAATPATVVDNAQNTYSFAFCLGQDDTFSGARITYGYNSAGD